MLSLVLQHIYFIPRRAVRIHLAGIANILKLNPAALEIIHLVPKDPDTCISYFDIDPTISRFLTCPRCHCLYPLESLDRSIINCTFKSAAESPPCGEPLWGTRRINGYTERARPLKIYSHHDLKSWIGRLFSRPGIEDMVTSRPHISGSAPESINDIWLSKVFSDLKDSSGKKFYPGPGSEVRLVFSLSVDSFNPFGNKTAKQSVSSTGIWLVLLNLPPNVRHLPENIYLAGIIPGPNKPSLTELNRYLQLVVNELLVLWNPGLALTRTFKYKLGRNVKGMIVPVVCDLLGAHQVIGYASAPGAHYMCPLCDLDKDDINILDRHKFPLKNWADSREFATLWRDATSEEHRKQIFSAFGWRWSALFDLPYFDPTMFTVIDSMHAIDLGLLQMHCREIYKIDLEHEGVDGYIPPEDKDQSRASLSHQAGIKKCIKFLHANPSSLLFKLLEFNRNILYSICLLYDIRGENPTDIVGTRWILAVNIFIWVSKKIVLHTTREAITVLYYRGKTSQILSY